MTDWTQRIEDLWTTDESFGDFSLETERLMNEYAIERLEELKEELETNAALVAGCVTEIDWEYTVKTADAHESTHFTIQGMDNTRHLINKAIRKAKGQDK
jgi:hypothetical protein